MRTVEAHLLGDKMEEAVTHYINTHQQSEHVHIDTDGMPMAVQDDGSRITVMHQQSYSSHLCRQVSVSESVGDGPWNDELLDRETRIAAIVAHLAQNSRSSHPSHPHHKVPVRNEVNSSVILDSSIRFNGQALDQQSPLVALPPMQTLPPLQEMKRCESDWFTDKNKKNGSQLPQLAESDGPILELGGSPVHGRQPNRKSLPHKKRISRKLKRNNGNCTPQQVACHDELVVINCAEAAAAPRVEEEQILPDSYVAVPQAHIPHEMRPILICQICGEFYGEEQLKFYQHLKQHYEPHAAIIIDSPVSHLVMDKMTNTCIVDNVATLPDSIVELSLENTVPKTMYQPMDKHILYTSSDKGLSYNGSKSQYSMAGMDKESVPVEPEKADLYDTLDKLELYNCGKCSKTFRKQKQCEAHVREAHSNTKLEDMGEFSEPEDLMAGIHVCVSEYEPPLLPHLTVDNGHVHQDHNRHWYSRNGGECDTCNEYCSACEREPHAHTHTHPHAHAQDAGHTHTSMPQTHSHVTTDAPDHETQPLKVLKEEVLQRIFDNEVAETEHHYNETIIQENENVHDNRNHHGGNEHDHGNHHNGNEHDHRIHHNGNEDDHRIHHNGNVDDHRIHHNGNEDDHRIHHGNEHDQVNHHDEIELERNHQKHDSHHEGNEHDQRNRQDHDNHDRRNQDPRTHDHLSEHDELEIQSNQTIEIEIDLKHPTNSLLKTVNSKSNNGRRKRLECSECGRVFGHRNSLMYHALSHAARQFACALCPKTFLTNGALKIHKRVHNGDKPYKCDLCERHFRQWSDLKYHKISLHSDEKKFKCEFCGKEFARKYSLNVHRRIHTGERNYKCDYCSKSFSASSYRLTHMRTHTGDRPYKCDQCEKSFRSSFDLRRHINVHNKMKFSDQKPIKPKDKKPKIDKVDKLDPPKDNKKEPSPSRPPVLKKSPKKKSPSNKKGAPNVTVQNKEGQFKVDIDEFERPQFTKFKILHNYNDNKDNYKYKEPERDGFAVLKPAKQYRENTDGKLQVYTHVEKVHNGSIVTSSQVLGDIRHLEREVAREVRSDMNGGEVMENGFLERLTALYNVPA